MKRDYSNTGQSDPTTSLYGTLKYAYDFFNRELFGNKLASGVITFHRQRKVMGYASHRRWRNHAGEFVDEIAINPEYFEDYPLIEIWQTLCHEMVHLWQSHFGTPSRRNYHNKEWARKMKEIGLMPSSTGKPGGEETGEYMMDYVILDGRFMTACQILIAEGFHFPWFDCFPVIRQAVPVYAYRKDNTAIELDRQLRPGALSGAKRAQPKLADASPIDELASARTSFDTPPWLTATMIAAPEPVFTTRPTHRSGRVKYSCRGCQCNVWGKPGLNIACLDCNLPMIINA